MKRLIALMLAAIMMAGAGMLCGAEIQHPVMQGENYWLEEDGDYIVGAQGDIPAGMYQVASEGFTARVYLPDPTVISCKGGVLLEPKGDPATEDGGFTVEPGTYIVGEDFPAGSYSVEAVESAPAGTDIVVMVYDEGYQYLYSERIDVDEDIRIRKMDLYEGYTVDLRNGAAHFEPYSDITFD